MSVYIVMLNLGSAHENHVAAVFSTPELAQAYCNEKNARESARSYGSRYSYDWHSREINADL